MDALSQAKGAGKLGRGLQTLGMAAMPFGLAQLSGITGAQSLGKPDPTALNDMISQQQAAMGTYSNMTPGEIDQDPMGNLNAMSMMAYGKSYDAMTQELGGVPPSFTYGYKNGDVDPTTNATYAYGQSVNSNGDVSYGGVTDFGISMEAMGKTGFMGHLGDVDRVKNSLTATPKQKQAAIDYERYVKTKTKYGKDVDVDKISDRSFGDVTDTTDAGDGGGPTGDPDDDSSAATDTGTASASGTAGQAAADSSQTDSGPGSDDNPDESGTGDAESMGDDGGMGPTAKGGLVNKRKPKPKKMKRGGLASR